MSDHSVKRMCCSNDLKIATANIHFFKEKRLDLALLRIRC